MRLLGAGLFFLLAACASTLRESPADLVLKAVDVIDVETAAVLEDQDVVIRGGRIVAVHATRDEPLLRGVQIVDARGQYIIPALWDLHVHLEASVPPEHTPLDPRLWHAPLSMSYGVLGMRDLGSRTDDILALRLEFTNLRAAGEPAPILRVVGQSFSGRQPWGTFDHTLIPETPAEAVAMVNRQSTLGVDFIKVHDFLSPDIYRAIVQTARANSMRVVGHLRSFSGPLESAALGQTDFDHVPPELLAYCGSAGQIDTEAFYEGWYTGGPGYYEREMANLYDRDGCRAMFSSLAALSVSVTPTLSVRAPVRARTYEAARRFLPAGQMTMCAETKMFRDTAATLDRDAYRAAIGALVRDMADARINILTGADGSAESCGIPGLILLDELDELVEAGLTRAQALRAATSGGARAAGVAEAGSVETGALADLVLLSANPLEDFSALTEPAGIVSAGRYISRSDLLALREDAARYAQSSAP